MKVGCPHCLAAYKIDDSRVPATGLKVRCPRCRQIFAVRRRIAAPPADGAAISPTAPPPPSPPAPEAPEAPEAGNGAVPLPPPPAASPVAAAAADLKLEPNEPPAGAGATPSSPGPPSPGADTPAIPAPPPQAALPPSDPLPVEPAARAEPLGFGEVDLGSPPAHEQPATPQADPLTAAVPPSAGPPATTVPPASPSAPSRSDGEELEALFGDGAAASKGGSRPDAARAYKVRRRSGKIFGPFEEAQIAEMLGKGELLGNEDVSADGGATWSPIGAVPAFGEALRHITVAPAVAPGGAEPQRGIPFGDRMAGAKVVEGGRGRPAFRKVVLSAAAVLVLLAAGAGAGFTRFGFFFVKAFRRADAAKVAALLGEARASLDRAEYPADRAALDAAARAAAADPDSAQAAALHAMVVAALELRHGAPPAALDQARRAADRLDADERGKIPALAARLAVALATAPGAGTLPHESALEEAAAKAPPDADAIALLAQAAVARGDGPRAAALFARLEQLRPGTARAGHGAGLALVAKRDVAGAKAAFARVLGAAPTHLASHLELAALSEAAGELSETEAQLAPLFAEGAEAKLAPAERARALVLRGALIARVSSRAAEADRAFEAAVQADPRLADARLALARHRLQHGDPSGAVAALEPLAAQAAAAPAAAAVRIRALAAAGRALDASRLADQALGRSPGDPTLLLAKAAALAAAGKGDEAAPLYRDAAARDPGAFEPRLALGRIALARGDLAAARLELAAAVEKGPREPSAQAGLGELAVAEGDAAAAEKAFLAALGLDAGYAPAEIGLAKLALAKGDAAAARTRLERALAVEPRSVDAHVALGTVLRSAKDLPSAEKAFQTAVDLQPRNAFALTGLGAVKLERGEDVDGAVQRLTAATNEDPRLAEARQWLGRALLRKGETTGAIGQLRKAVDLDPKNAEHHLHLGIAIERSGALAEAAEEYRASAAADPKLAEAHERLGMLLAANGRFEEAAAAYEKAIAAAPKVSRHRIALADCKEKLGKHEAAVRIYRAVMKVDPAAVQVLYKLARALHEWHGASAALPYYERAARGEPANPMPHYYLGYLYKERAQKAKAAAEFRRFLALKPDADEKKDIEAELEDLGGAR